MKNQDKPHLYSIVDHYWFLLQNKDKWILITPISVIQREYYSDIQQKMFVFVNICLIIHLFSFTPFLI
jgi:hypothetical protein